MASMLLKGVHKRLGLPTISISCSSADATSVVASTGPGSGSSSRIIDRHSPRLRDPHRSSTSKPPRPSSSSSGDNTKDSSASSPNSSQQHGHGSKKKKSTTVAATANGRISSEKRLVSPATSSRFLLNSSRMQSDNLGVDMLALPPPPPPPPSFIDVFPGKDEPLPPWPVHFPEEKEKASVVQVGESSSSGSSSASSSSEITAAPVGHEQEEVMKRSCSTRRTQAGQVVVLRVSLHCKGCAGKVKKHIAKMEGVTSFDIDIASKKVTVVGDVTPLGVLNSVSKVKPAQFWHSPPRATCPPRASASF
ncbi:hypothetical protein ACQ4PT_026920 [Festuca glaucescens]